MDPNPSGHDPTRDPMSSEAEFHAPALQVGIDGAKAETAAGFDALYREHFAFVWRSIRRLGVPEPLVDDAVQEVFVVVHRQWPGLEIRVALRAWLFGIVTRVASEFRRKIRRKDPRAREGVERLIDPGTDPQATLEKADAARVLSELLEELDWQKREVFVLIELEEMRVPEVASALGVNVNTVYSRIRAARVAFNEAVARYTAREQWRTR